MAFIRNIILLVIIVNTIIAQDRRPSVAVLDFDAICKNKKDGNT